MDLAESDYDLGPSWGQTVRVRVRVRVTIITLKQKSCNDLACPSNLLALNGVELLLYVLYNKKEKNLKKNGGGSKQMMSCTRDPACTAEILRAL